MVFHNLVTIYIYFYTAQRKSKKTMKTKALGSQARRKSHGIPSQWPFGPWDSLALGSMGPWGLARVPSTKLQDNLQTRRLIIPYSHYAYI